MRFAHALFWSALLACGAAPAPAAVADEATPAIPAAWLQVKVTVAEAEAAHPGTRDERATRFSDVGKPFGFQHRAWEELKAQMLPGDQLWTFASPADSWQHLAGRAGIALVRNGLPIRTLVTVMN